MMEEQRSEQRDEERESLEEMAEDKERQLERMRRQWKDEERVEAGERLRVLSEKHSRRPGGGRRKSRNVHRFSKNSGAR